MWRGLEPWARAFRPPAQINLALPMLVGLLHNAPWSMQTLGHGLGLSLLLQAMILYSNDASDATTDDLSQRTLISGGSGVGAEGSLSPHALRRAAITAGALGLAGSYALGSTPLATVWLMACTLVWAYDGQPLRLSRHPMGCFCQALGVGVVTPLLGAWLVTAPAWPTPAALLIGLSLGASGHILSALPDEQSDRRVGKKTIVVWLGARRSFALLLFGLAVAGFLQLGTVEPHHQASAMGGGMMLAGVWWLRESVGRNSSHRWLGRRPGNLTLDVWLAGLVSIALWTTWMFH